MIGIVFSFCKLVAIEQAGLAILEDIIAIGKVCYFAAVRTKHRKGIIIEWLGALLIIPYYYVEFGTPGTLIVCQVHNFAAIGIEGGA